MPCGQCRKDFDPFWLRGALPDHVLVRLRSLYMNDPLSSEDVHAAGYQLPVTSPWEDVRREAKERSQELMASYKVLHNIIERHEATIQKRWANKGRQKRSEILRAAWPGMATTHRQDFDIYWKERVQHNHEVHGMISAEYKEQFMWPYINQEDLSKSRPLLLLLNARGRRHPSEFAAADNEAMQLGKATKVIVPVFLDEYVMVMNRVKGNEEYGKLLNWRNNPGVLEWLITGKQMDPGEGLLVLEAQQRLLDFLVRCCQNLLHEIPPEGLTADAYPIQQEPQMRAERDASGFVSLAALAADAPYKVPSRLDLGRIESLLGAQVSAMEDHILALREDPAYFAQEISDVKEHRHEMLHWPWNRARLTCTPKPPGHLWKDIVRTFLLDAYYDLEVHSELWRWAKNLQALHARYRAFINPRNDLPEEFLMALMNFYHHLTQAAREPLCQLWHELSASPPLRKFYVCERRRYFEPDQPRGNLTRRSDLKLSKFQEKLLWLLEVLGEDDRSLAFIGLTVVVDEIERFLQADPRAQELVSSRLAKNLSKISVISQCLNQIDMYQPWAAGFRYILARKQNHFETVFANGREPLDSLMEASAIENLGNVAQLGKITEGRFSYPAGKRRSKANIEAMQKAERDLDEFWASADLILNGLGLKSLKPLKLHQRTWQRTPNWVEPPPSRKAHKGKVQNTDGLDQSLLSLSDNITWQHQEGNAKQDLLQPKAKIKTKGTPHNLPPAIKTVNATVHDGVVAAEVNNIDVDKIDVKVGTDAKLAKIPVDARALKVFRALFFDPEVTCTPGEVSWSDFLHAMSSIGFKAEKLYGSAWQFQALGPNRVTIQFHEPHPRKKIPFNTARRHGRRLNRAFGWDSTTFKLREKVKA